jgi:membrane-associated phospholipid phosphatase
MAKQKAHAELAWAFSMTAYLCRMQSLHASNHGFSIRHTLSLSLALAALCGGPRLAFAQDAASSRPTPADTAERHRPLFTARDGAIALAFVGGTIIAFPLDKRVARRLENPGTQANRFLGQTATDFELIASPGAYVIGGSLYAIGRLGNFGRVADLGLHGTEAVFVADGVTGVLKGLLGRSRPYVTLDSNPRDFKFGTGFTDPGRTSFPSGHATSAFAAAAAVTAETGRWWPRSTRIVGPLMYGGATMVGLSRMYHNKHWLSDVIVGAAIGTFSGQKVAQFNHDHPRNIIDRALLHTSLMSDGHGETAVTWSLAVP